MKAKNPCAITHHHEVSDEVSSGKCDATLHQRRERSSCSPTPHDDGGAFAGNGTLVNSIVCLTRYLMPPATIILSLFHSSIPSINTFIYQLSIRHGRAMGTDFQGLRREDLFYLAIDSECERR